MNGVLTVFTRSLAGPGCLFVGLALTFLFPVSGDCQPLQSGTEPAVTDWEFRTIQGETIKPFPDSETRAAVLVFISTDCPIANSYHPMLIELEKEYRSRGIRFFLVHSTPDVTQESAAKHARDYRLTIPVVLDRDQSIARNVGATVTPEAVVISRESTEPVYRGRIDNLYADYGKKRSVATRHFLADALEQFAAGKKVEVPKTKPIGCFIEFREQQKPEPGPSGQHE